MCDDIRYVLGLSVCIFLECLIFNIILTQMWQLKQSVSRNIKFPILCIVHTDTHHITIFNDEQLVNST